MAYRNGDLEDDGFYDSLGSSYELIESICDIFQVPQIQRERHFQEALRLLNKRRPLSVISSRSASGSQASSTGSFHMSTSSARTSYMSSILEQDIEDPQPLSAFQDINPRSLTIGGERQSPIEVRDRERRSFQSRTSSLSSVRQYSEVDSHTAGPEKLTSNVRRARCCPWCDETFTRPNDFKKHVVRFCCARKFWACNNPVCDHISSKFRRAKQHGDQSGDPMCMINGWTKLELQCERRHFGCQYCAEYFSDLEKFLDHFGQSCRPDRVAGKKPHQSSKMIALLQQPRLLSCVENLCLRLHSNKDAYKSLYWCWRKDVMARMIEQLEYGPKAVVDRQNPGIAFGEVETFLVPLIQLSNKTRYYSDLRQELLVGNSRPSASLSKPLPPVPEADLHSVEPLSISGNDTSHARTYYPHSPDTPFDSITNEDLLVGQSANSYYPGYPPDSYGHATYTATLNQNCPTDSGQVQDFTQMSDCLDARHLPEQTWHPMEIDTFVADRTFVENPTAWL